MGGSKALQTVGVRIMWYCTAPNTKKVYTRPTWNASVSPQYMSHGYYSIIAWSKLLCIWMVVVLKSNRIPEEQRDPPEHVVCLLAFLLLCGQLDPPRDKAGKTRCSRNQLSASEWSPERYLRREESCWKVFLPRRRLLKHAKYFGMILRREQNPRQKWDGGGGGGETENRER